MRHIGLKAPLEPVIEKPKRKKPAEKQEDTQTDTVTDGEENTEM